MRLKKKRVQKRIAEENRRNGGRKGKERGTSRGTKKKRRKRRRRRRRHDDEDDEGSSCSRIAYRSVSPKATEPLILIIGCSLGSPRVPRGATAQRPYTRHV